MDRLLVARLHLRCSRHPGHLRASLVLPVKPDEPPAVVSQRRRRQGAPDQPADVDLEKVVEANKRLITCTVDLASMQCTVPGDLFKKKTLQIAFEFGQNRIVSFYI